MMEKENAGKPKKDWKLPKGYKSAIGRARDAQKAKELAAKKAGKMAPFVSDEEDTASEGAFSDSDNRFHIDALRFVPVSKGTPMSQARRNVQNSSCVTHVNSFTGIDADDNNDNLSDDHIQSLNSWASNVTMAQNLSGKGRKIVPRQTSKLDRTARYIESNQRSDAVIVVKNDRDANKLENEIASVPQSRKSIARTMKKASAIKLEPDERLATVDSGSFEHACDADVEIPDSMGYVIDPPSASDLNKSAETACGGVLKILGRFRHSRWSQNLGAVLAHEGQMPHHQC